LKTLHIHHIEPKYLIGEDNSPNNLTPPISLELHAALHKDLFKHFGNTEDFIAWKSLLGLSLQGITFTPEIRKKMSEASIGRKHTEKFKQDLAIRNSQRIWKDSSRQKIGQAQQGRIHTEEHNKKISENHKGMKGKKHSEESKKKMSEVKKGKKLSEETKKKIGISSSKALKGHKVSEETKIKISNSCKGRIAWNKGKKENIV
jgi:hypothetical protein